MTFRNLIDFGGSGQYRMFWPCPGREGKCCYWVIYKADYSSYNGSSWWSEKFCNIFFSKNVFHTPVISLSRILIVSGHMINTYIDVMPNTVSTETITHMEYTVIWKEFFSYYSIIDFLIFQHFIKFSQLPLCITKFSSFSFLR